MAIDVEASTEINLPPEDVFAAITDYKHIPDWVEPIHEIRNVSNEIPVVGTTFQQIGTFMGKDMVIDTEVLAYEPSYVFSFRGTKPFPMTITFELEASAKGTIVHQRMQGDPGGFFGMVGGLLGGQLKKSMEKDHQSLKKLLGG